MRISMISSLLVWCAVAAFSQAPGPNGVQFGDIIVTGSLRSRVYDWNWFETPGAENRYTYSGNLLRLNFAGKRNHFDWRAEFAVPFLLSLPEKATAPAPQGALGFGSNYYFANGSRRNAAMMFPKQLFLRLSSLGGGEAQKLQIGRFVFVDGTELVPKNTTVATLKRDRVSQRLLGDFGFSDVGRSFDGLRYSYSKSSHDFTLVAAIPTRGVFQVDGWGWNKAAFGYAAYTRDWGQDTHAADTRLFVLAYNDWRHVLKTDNWSGQPSRGGYYPRQRWACPELAAGSAS